MLHCSVSESRVFYGFEYGLKCLKMYDVRMVMFSNENDKGTMEGCNDFF